VVGLGICLLCVRCVMPVSGDEIPRLDVVDAVGFSRVVAFVVGRVPLLGKGMGLRSNRLAVLFGLKPSPRHLVVVARLIEVAAHSGRHRLALDPLAIPSLRSGERSSPRSRRGNPSASSWNPRIDMQRRRRSTLMWMT
jgi:hypothetical protein